MINPLIARARSKPDHAMTVKNGAPLPPSFTTESDKHPFFFRDWKWAKPLNADKPIEMFPGVYTFDAEYLRFLTLAAQRGPELFKPQVEDDLCVGPNGIHKSMSSIATVSGKYQTPVSYPLRDNIKLREELGLPNDWRRPRDEQIFRNWCRIFFSHWKDMPIRTKDRSKSGSPHMVYTAAEKVPLVEEALVPQTLEKIFKKIVKRDLRALRKDHQFIITGTCGTRGQSDIVAKVRRAADRAFAESGGARGSMIDCLKNVNVDGIEYADLVAMRKRLIIGYPVIPNTIGQIASTGHLHAIYERFPLVFKITDHQEHVDEICANFLPDEPALAAWSGDVSNFDASALPDFIYKVIDEEYRSVWHEGMADLQDLIHRAPYFTPPMSAEDTPYWSGNPDNPDDFDGRGSLKSGDNKVSIAGILSILGDMLIVADYAFGDVLGNEEDILLRRAHYHLVNKGDDHRVWGSPETVARYADFATRKDEQGRVQFSYYKIESEDGNQLIGGILQRQGPRKFKVLPRLMGLFEKSFANEHDAGSVFRPVWPIGGFVRKELYGANPSYTMFNDAIDDWWAESGAKARYGSLQVILDKGMDSIAGYLRAARSVQDLDALITPQKLDYRYVDGMVSEEIMEKFKKKVNQELTRGVADKFYSGRIIEYSI